MLTYVPSPPDLAAVDPRWHALNDDDQQRVADLMLTVASIPMALAIDAVLLSEGESRDDYDNR